MKIELPQGRFFLASESSDPVILVAGGRPPNEKWLKQVAQRYPVWAIDRGIDVCRSAAVIPKILVGDADSGAVEAWQWAESHHVPIVRHSIDKDLTDLQLTLQELGGRHPGASALLTGGMGRRFDHAYSNVFSLQESKLWDVHAIGLVDEAEALFLVEGGQAFRAELTQSPIAVSLMPLSAVCDNVNSRGVHWPLQEATLTMKHPGGICNRLAEGSQSVSVSLDHGLLGVYFCWRESGL